MNRLYLLCSFSTTDLGFFRIDWCAKALFTRSTLRWHERNFKKVTSFVNRCSFLCIKLSDKTKAISLESRFPDLKLFLCVLVCVINMYDAEFCIVIGKPNKLFWYWLTFLSITYILFESRLLFRETFIPLEFVSQDYWQGLITSIMHFTYGVCVQD